MSKISPGTILLGFMAVLCGLLGAFFAMRPPVVPPSKVAAAPQPITVPVASANLEPGRRITLGDVAILRMTREEMQKRGIRGGFMASSEHIIGRVLRSAMPMGSPFRTDALYPEGLGPGIEEALSPGHRAITVSVGGDDALLGFASAGSWVDVIFRSGGEADNQYRHTRADEQMPEITVTLIQRARVLAIDRNTLSGTPESVARETDETVPVTLEVTPEQAQKLRVVEGRGLLSLALRAPDDCEVQDGPMQQRTLDDVLQRDEVVRHMEVYKGTTFERLRFERGTGNWRAQPSQQTAAALNAPLRVAGNSGDDSSRN